MGFSVVIAGSIIVIALLASSFTIINSINNILNVSEAFKDSVILYDDIINTKIWISSIQASSNGDLVVITLVNNGTTKLWNFNDFDLIITYDANITNSKVRVVEHLSYSTYLSNGRWIIDSITNDVLDPNIINSNEEGIIHAKLSNRIYPAAKLIVSVSTDNGVTYTRVEVL